jgi:hypothetical protein
MRSTLGLQASPPSRLRLDTASRCKVCTSRCLPIQRTTAVVGHETQYPLSVPWSGLIPLGRHGNAWRTAEGSRLQNYLDGKGLYGEIWHVPTTTQDAALGTAPPPSVLTLKADRTSFYHAFLQSTRVKRYLDHWFKWWRFMSETNRP